jgi:tellurite resistance protein
MPFDPSALLNAAMSEAHAQQLDAIVDTMVLAADSDGELGDEEQQTLADNIAKLARGTEHAEEMAGQKLMAKIRAARQQISDGDRDGLIETVKSRLRDADARRAALGLAIVVTNADGIVRTSERELIMDLADALEIDRDEAADLVRDITRP